jgi:ABC-type antimicrobial peptide transport system permease subunit
MALGAQASDVIVLILRGGMAVAVAGCVAGAVGAAALAHLISSRLYGVPPIDPLTFLATIVLLLLVSLLACWLPSRRATKVDPMIALRSE